MKIKILITSVLVTSSIIAGVAFYMYQKPADKLVTEKSVYSVEAVSLFNEFSADESAANRKYLNQVITVEGVIKEVSAVDSLGLNIVLGTESPLFGINCQLPLGASESAPEIGQTINIKGLCTGMLMDVVLIKCRVEKN